MNTTIQQQIKDAIDRSRSYTEVVRVEIDGVCEDALSAVDAAIEMQDIDYVMLDRNTMDVWGWTDETPANEQDWRIQIRLTGDSE